MCRADVTEVDSFAGIQLILAIKYDGITWETLNVRWLEEATDSDAVARHLKMPWLQWQTPSNSKIGDAVYDLILVVSVNDPAYLKPDPRPGSDIVSFT